MFEGFRSGWPDDEIVRSWEWLKDYGVLPYAGGMIDQPQEWRDDMDMCTAMYNVRVAVLAAERAMRDKT